MSRELAMDVAMRRGLERSRVGCCAGELAAEHAPTFARVELARQLAGRVVAGAEGIIVTPAEVFQDLEATTADAVALNNDWVARRPTIPAATWDAWDAWMRSFWELRRLILERYASYEQEERSAGGWNPIGRANFWRDVQALNTRLEDAKAQLRGWRVRFSQLTGAEPTSPERPRQTPPSEQVAPMLPSIAETASSLSTGVIVAAVAAVAVVFLAMRSA